MNYEYPSRELKNTNQPKVNWSLLKNEEIPSFAQKNKSVLKKKPVKPNGRSFSVKELGDLLLKNRAYIMVLNKEMNMMLFKPPHLGLSPNQKIKTVGGRYSTQAKTEKCSRKGRTPFCLKDVSATNV